MKFAIAETEKIIPGYNLERWVSENNIWEIRLDRVMFGCRVHVMRCGTQVFLTELCAGDLPIWQQALLGVVRSIVEQYPESISAWELEEVFPSWKIRPMFNDKKCWGKLCRMAGMDEAFEKSMLEFRYGPVPRPQDLEGDK